MDVIFDVEWTGMGKLMIKHRESQISWIFVVEAKDGRRFLKPSRSPDGKMTARAMITVRRTAFAHAVAEARGRNLID